jgi:hypothetical protein
VRHVVGLARAIGLALWPGKRLPAVRVGGILALALVGAFWAGMNVWGPPDTIVKHEVGPTHTVYAKQPEPPVKLIQVDQPQSCKDAIALAASLASNAVIMADSAGPLNDAMKDAGVALGTQDKNKMNAATEKVNKLNAATLKAKKDYAIIYPQFTAKQQQCREDSAR